MDAAALTTLRLANPWLERPELFPAAAAFHIPERWIPRRVPGMKTWPEPRQAHLIVGARQVGRSSLMWSWLVGRGQAPLYVNCEEHALRSWCGSPTEMLADIRGLLAPDAPIFLEEAQHLAETGLLVKGLIDGGLQNPLFVTGSSAFHLHSRTRESLAGRAVRVMLHPLSAAELAATLPPLPALLRVQRIRELCMRHVVQGGYPAVWTSDRPNEVLHRLIEAFVIRDASDLFRIQHTDAFRKLLLLLCGQVGNLVNTSEWAGHCGVSRDTIQAWLDILAETQLIQVVHPYAGGRRAELTHRPKVYFCDNGLLNAIIRRPTPFDEREDRGPLLENWVGGELRKHLSPLLPQDALRYWRSTSKAEVDFVVERPKGLVGIEVKASPLQEPQLSRSAHSFIDAYKPVRFVVLNLALNAEEVVGQTSVLWRTPDAMADVGGLLEG